MTGTGLTPDSLETVLEERTRPQFEGHPLFGVLSKVLMTLRCFTEWFRKYFVPTALKPLTDI